MLRITTGRARGVGNAIRRFLKTETAAQYLPPDQSWLLGGSWLLAEALRREMARRRMSYQLFAIIDDEWSPWHVALGACGWAWGAEGAVRLTTMLDRWETRLAEKSHASAAVPLGRDVEIRAALRGFVLPEEPQVKELRLELKRVIGD